MSQTIYNICILEPRTSCISPKQPLVSPHGSLLLRCAFLNSVFPLARTHRANLGQHTSPLLLCVIQDLWTRSHLVAIVAVNLQTLTQLLSRSLRVLHYSKKYIHIDVDRPSAYKLHFGECLIVPNGRAKQSRHSCWDLAGPSYPRSQTTGWLGLSKKPNCNGGHFGEGLAVWLMIPQMSYCAGCWLVTNAALGLWSTWRAEHLEVQFTSRQVLSVIES